jgi:hypothetical protein
MKRGIQIVVSLWAIVLLARPFDCFANARTPEAMKCCMKGQCVPSAKADDCCKNTVPDTNHFLAAKTTGHRTPLVALDPAPVSMPLLELSVPSWEDSARRPPPLLSLTALNLPLII